MIGTVRIHTGGLLSTPLKVTGRSTRIGINRDEKWKKMNAD
jgi:hypothetical protein